MTLLDDILKAGARAALQIEPATERLKAIRLAICRGSCDRYEPRAGKCLECGCYMEVKAGTKTHRNPRRGMQVEVTHCPLGKWFDKDLADKYKNN